MKTLIVDDSLLAEFALKAYFVKLGYEVVGLAKNAEIALEMVEKFNPDLITVDAVMPGMSGLDLIKLINKRDKAKRKRTSIFMISSDNIRESDRKLVDVDSYIIKPITMVKLQQALNKI